jgi:hypothetical protein
VVVTVALAAVLKAEDGILRRTEHRAGFDRYRGVAALVGVVGAVGLCGCEGGSLGDEGDEADGYYLARTIAVFHLHRLRVSDELPCACDG